MWRLQVKFTSFPSYVYLCKADSWPCPSFLMENKLRQEAHYVRILCISFSWQLHATPWIWGSVVPRAGMNIIPTVVNCHGSWIGSGVLQWMKLTHKPAATKKLEDLLLHRWNWKTLLIYTFDIDGSDVDDVMMIMMIMMFVIFTIHVYSQFQVISFKFNSHSLLP